MRCISAPPPQLRYAQHLSRAARGGQQPPSWGIPGSVGGALRNWGLSAMTLWTTIRIVVAAGVALYRDVQDDAANGRDIHIAGNSKLGIRPITISSRKLLNRARGTELRARSVTITRTDPISGHSYLPMIETNRVESRMDFYGPAFFPDTQQHWSFVKLGFKHDLLHEDPSTAQWDNYPIEHLQPFNNAAHAIGGP